VFGILMVTAKSVKASQNEAFAACIATVSIMSGMCVLNWSTVQGGQVLCLGTGFERATCCGGDVPTHVVDAVPSFVICNAVL
jgi:hypothetical protein